MAETNLSGPENLHVLVSVLLCILCFQGITFLRIYLLNARFSPTSLNMLVLPAIPRTFSFLFIYDRLPFLEIFIF